MSTPSSFCISPWTPSSRVSLFTSLRLRKCGFFCFSWNVGLFSTFHISFLPPVFMGGSFLTVTHLWKRTGYLLKKYEKGQGQHEWNQSAISMCISLTFQRPKWPSLSQFRQKFLPKALLNTFPKVAAFSWKASSEMTKLVHKHGLPCSLLLPMGFLMPLWFWNSYLFRDITTWLTCILSLQSRTYQICLSGLWHLFGGNIHLVQSLKVVNIAHVCTEFGRWTSKVLEV